MPTETAADWTKFWELIKDIKFAMFTAHASDGHMHSRPMTTQNKNDDRAGVLWFFMSRSSEPVIDIGRDASVNAAYADPGSDAYVSVAGRARLVDDIAKKKATVEHRGAGLVSGRSHRSGRGARRGHHRARRLLRTSTPTRWCSCFKMAKAAMTGVPPKMGEHRELHSGVNRALRDVTAGR